MSSKTRYLPVIKTARMLTLPVSTQMHGLLPGPQEACFLSSQVTSWGAGESPVIDCPGRAVQGGVAGDSLMEEVRSDLDLKKLGSTRSDRKEVGRLPQAVGWQIQAIATGWVETKMEEWVPKIVSGNV